VYKQTHLGCGGLKDVEQPLCEGRVGLVVHHADKAGAIELEVGTSAAVVVLEASDDRGRDQ
jgi:hypothetical protein